MSRPSEIIMEVIAPNPTTNLRQPRGKKHIDLGRYQGYYYEDYIK